MPRLIKVFADGRHLEFDQGRFDPWCIYLVCPNGARQPPLDKDYFSVIHALVQVHGRSQVYKDFVAIYERTAGEIDEAVLRLITLIASSYAEDALKFDVAMTTIYAGMIAEERKAFTKLGKRVKRLGMHQVIVEGVDPTIAANFSRGKRWREIDALCSARGF